jgi:hypothetical protein
MAGTLLVVGSAPCVHEDIEKALKIRPLASVMLVNGACTLIENAEHVLSGHTDCAEAFAKQRRAKFPNAQPWRLHATIVSTYATYRPEQFPSVTDWWDKSYAKGATSAAKAATIGLLGLGFDEVILCGCPLQGTGYAEGEARSPVLGRCHRIGDPNAQHLRVIGGYRMKYERFANEFRGRVFSMSGFTRECSGAPPEKEK